MHSGSPKFRFEPRWKEELVCSCSLGSFLLEMPMGVVSVCLPSETTWLRSSPDWAKPHWEAFRTQLREWCSLQGIPLCVSETADVWQV